MAINKIIEKLRHTGAAFSDVFKNFIPERVEPEFLNCVCPKCCSRDLELLEIHENKIEHAFCVFKCRACGASFIMWEDYIDFCRRQIQNAENVIESQNEKIKYFNKLLQKGTLWRYLRK